MTSHPRVRHTIKLDVATGRVTERITRERRGNVYGLTWWWTRTESTGTLIISHDAGDSAAAAAAHHRIEQFQKHAEFRQHERMTHKDVT